MKRFMGLKKAVQALAVNRFFCIETSREHPGIPSYEITAFSDMLRNTFFIVNPCTTVVKNTIA